MDMLLHPEFTQGLFERLTDHYVALYKNYMEAIGDYIQMVIYYEDVSGQDGPLISPALYRKYVKPCHRRIFKTIREHTAAKICVHTCGSVYAFLDDYVEMGVDVINPVQISARDMDPRRLKEKYGSVLSLPGGDRHPAISAPGYPPGGGRRGTEGDRDSGAGRRLPLHLLPQHPAGRFPGKDRRPV